MKDLSDYHLPSIVLDEKQYASIKQDSSLPLYNFFFLNMDNKKEFITQRYGDTLIAVTEQQYKNWKFGRTVICERAK